VTNLNQTTSIGNGGTIYSNANDLIQVDIFMTNDSSFGVMAATFQAYGFGAGLSY